MGGVSNLERLFSKNALLCFVASLLEKRVAFFWVKRTISDGSDWEHT
jgi:hypothetical protein